MAYDAALAVITKRKWRIVVERSPQAGRRDGQIEAVARTAIMGFRDDVAVRIRATRDGALIDVRSASRYGRHDLGANASRIRSLLEDIDEEIGVPHRPAGTRGAEEAAAEAAPAKRLSRRSGNGRMIEGGPSVATAPRATRSSRCASTDMPAARVSRGSRLA